MRRFVCLLAGVLLVVPSLGSDEPREYDGVSVWHDGLQGTWRVTTAQIIGKLFARNEAA